MPARLVRIALGAFRRRTSRRFICNFRIPAFAPKFDERRSSPRLPFALPITIRRDGAYAAESTMTLDLSYVGVRFEATRFYAPDDFVHVHIPSGSWAERGEIPGRVLRIDPFGGDLRDAATALIARRNTRILRW